jgi:dATP pyrophosphohydrolase
VSAGSDFDGSFKRPESVLVVVYTRARECLLLERAHPRGFWQSVTGSLRWGETPAEGAARELDEETGLAATGLHDARVQREFPILPAWRARYSPGDAINREHLFYLELAEPEPVRIHPHEHVAYEWSSFDVGMKKVGSWTNREALERLQRGWPSA